MFTLRLKISQDHYGDCTAGICRTMKMATVAGTAAAGGGGGAGGVVTLVVAVAEVVVAVV